MKANEIFAGYRYQGSDQKVREVLGKYTNPWGAIRVDYVMVPGSDVRTCYLGTFAKWAKRVVTEVL